MQLAELLILGLAVWRIARLVQYERGPRAVFTTLRERLGVEHDADGEPMGWPDGEIGRLVRCIDCGTIWISAGMVALFVARPDLCLLVALPFALSAIAMAVGVIIDGQGRY